MLLLLALGGSSLQLASSQSSESIAPCSCESPHDSRTLFDIAWGCFATLFACVWVSVHPNVPPPPPEEPLEPGVWKRVKWHLQCFLGPLKRRLTLMAVAVLAPELIFGLAVRQLVMARHFARKHEISITHGFFVGMGGFVDAEKHPVVTDKQIDSNSAVRAEIQSTPLFSIQAKISTLAFAVLTSFIWLIWLKKPLDVQEPIQLTNRISILDQPSSFAAGPDLPQAGTTLIESLDRVRLPGTVQDSARDTEAADAEASARAVKALPEAALAGLPGPEATKISSGVPVRSGTSKPSHRKMLLHHLGNILVGGLSSSVANLNSATSVPAFWCGVRNDLPASLVLGSLILELICGSVFGAIHCIVWFVEFPSTMEMWIWRSSAALISAVAPIFILPFLIYFMVRTLVELSWLVISFLWQHISRGDTRVKLAKDWDDVVGSVLGPVFLFVWVLYGVIYCLARALILTLMLTTLRSLPAEAFINVNWNLYIPHL
ncbi:hypothetical protein MIND_01423600 [Mycena indigotica]|uniref:Uncharacterized protein n=1 Tax=Mycena indigotica TaxID=2126181 RepID=A0A8H6VPE5_9AGAR|nr:uncharacterized protein MIND_01423600 [Mycena indigotica]KAF7288779.1 hypothetical protein MIND_01423600 [Mycena indigotica]